MYNLFDNNKVADWCSRYPRKTFLENEILICGIGDSSHLLYIEEGYVRLFITTSQSIEITLVIYKSGSILPFSFLISDWKKTEDYVFVAITKVVARIVPYDKFVLFLKEKPELLFLMLSSLSGGLSGLLVRLENNFLSKPDQIIFLLNYLSNSFGVKTGKNEEVVIPFPVTSEILSTWLGTSRETVSRVLADLKRKGVIEQKGKKVTILKFKALVG